MDVVRTLSSIATLNRKRADNPTARRQFEEVLARFDRGVGRRHPFATESLFGMGEVLKYSGALREAEPYYRAALENFSGVIENANSRPPSVSTVTQTIFAGWEEAPKPRPWRNARPECSPISRPNVGAKVLATI